MKSDLCRTVRVGTKRWINYSEIFSIVVTEHLPERLHIPGVTLAAAILNQENLSIVPDLNDVASLEEICDRFADAGFTLDEYPEDLKAHPEDLHWFVRDTQGSSAVSAGSAGSSNDESEEDADM